MTTITGYMVVLPPNKLFPFTWIDDNAYAEPVSEFAHPSNILLISFVIIEFVNITHIGLGRRGMRAGTNLRSLNIFDIFELKQPLSANEIANNTSPKISHHELKKIEKVGY